MRASLIALALAALSVPAYGAPPLFDDQFEWPDVQANSIPDARLTSALRAAREQAREAANLAAVGRRSVALAGRRVAIRKFLGKGDRPQTIAAGTVMTATPVDGENGPMIGKTTYPSGASMIGLIGNNVGVYTPASESRLAEFSGEVFGALTETPQPMTGVFELRNGESFTGSMNAGTNAEGIYSSADGERRFVGTINMANNSFHPIKGVLEDRKKRLLAVINTDLQQ